MKKKLITIIIAALVGLTACSAEDSSSGGDSSSASVGESAVSSDASSTADSEGESTSSDAAPSEPSSPTKLLSNEIKLNADGDIDMETALAYQTDFDALVAELSSRPVDPTKPVSQNINEAALEVWEYLRSVYGKQVITCQQMGNSDALEDLVFYNASKDLPAMKGFDFIFCTGSYLSDAFIDDAIEWHKKSGGLVTFTWHWNVPVNIDDPKGSSAFYVKEIENFSQFNAVTPGTKEYEQVIHDIDWIATKLQRLESEGVTVLFRPLHEASGSWFWWGLQDRSSAENEVFQKLWYMIFDRLENYHKLTNIIWVWNGQSKYCKVNPNSYDIAGIDKYFEGSDKTDGLNDFYHKAYDELKALVGDDGKMMTLSECGYMPNPDDCLDSGNMWLYYMIWNGDFVYEMMGGVPRVSLMGTPYPNTERLTDEMITEYFTNGNFITHSKLPVFSHGTGSHEIPQRIKNWETN